MIKEEHQLNPKIKMNPIALGIWVKVLRGESYFGKTYEQGRKYLAKRGRHCCMGAYCDSVYGMHMEGWWGFPSNSHHLDESDLEFFKQRVGLGIFFPSLEDAIAELNDEHGYTFLELADMIESNF